MAITIRARYINDIFEPVEMLNGVDLAEGQEVELRIGEGLLDRVLREVRERNRDVPPDEVERDVEQALAAIRAEGSV